jgi:hypothetical protein
VRDRALILSGRGGLDAMTSGFLLLATIGDGAELKPATAMATSPIAKSDPTMAFAMIAIVYTLVFRRHRFVETRNVAPSYLIHPALVLRRYRFPVTRDVILSHDTTPVRHDCRPSKNSSMMASDL